MIEPVVWTDEMVQMIERGLARDHIRRLHGTPYYPNDEQEFWPTLEKANTYAIAALDQALPGLPEQPPAPKQPITIRDAMDYWMAHRKARP